MMLKSAPALLAMAACGALVFAEDQNNATRRPEAAAQARQNQQDRAQKRDEPGQVNARNDAEGQGLEQHVANCLVLGNQEEIAIIRFATDKIQNDDVKQLAQKMIQDHEKALESLKKFATVDGAELDLRNGTASDTSGAPAARRETAASEKPASDPPLSAAALDAKTARNEERISRTAGYAPHDNSLSSQLLQLDHRAAQECLKLTEQELSKYQGKDFDQAFLGQQLGMHLGMLARLKAAEQSVSGELQQEIQKSEQVTMNHKQQAEQLMDSLKGQPSAGGQRNSKEESKTRSSNNRSTQQ